MNPVNTTIEIAEKASAAGDRALFIAAIIFLVTVVIWMTRYVIGRMERIIESGHETTKNVAVAVARNTEALDNTSAVIKDCQTELIRCRERHPMP